jgi:two-component system, chemotaxis family, protein-glutamate methylesterase/glutaminase
MFQMIRVLIVEDSPVAQEFLLHIFSSDQEIEVVGVAENGLEAIDMASLKHPDVITMDIHMPIMDGFEATAKIMEVAPTPIVVVSSSTRVKEIDSTFRAMEAGALAVILRPPGIGHADYYAAARELIRTVKMMSEIKVVRRIHHKTGENTPSQPPVPQAPLTPSGIQVAAICASTGGPPALKTMLSRLPRDLNFPLLIVQHIAKGFIGGFAEWLANASAFPVHIASHGQQTMPGHCYLAPDGYHMEITADLRIALNDGPLENGLRPSAAALFRSMAQVFGPGAVGVLLTGMGRDGADELKGMKEKGAITIAQDKESSVVNGMPGEAVKINAATYVMSPEGIAEFLKLLSKKKNGGCQ